MRFALAGRLGCLELCALLCCLGLCMAPFRAAADISGDPYQFDDMPLDELLEYPPWFKNSFLALDEDLQEAVDNGKSGILVYFGQKRCAYCKMLMEVNFQIPDIVTYTRTHFYVVPIDIWSPEEVTTPSGETLSEREYSQKLGTTFTPSLVFYDAEGRIALRLRGYYPPYQFRAALEYVAEEYGVAREDVVFCGDSGNDIFPLTAGFSGVLVRNADDQLVANVRAAMRENPGLKVYFARGDFKGLSGFYTSGVIEGGYHYGVFSDP